MKNYDMPIFAGLIALLLMAPFAVYPVFLMKVLCFALFALAFNLLVGYVGLLSFGHAMFFGFSAYISAYTVKAWGWNPEFGILAGTAAAVAPSSPAKASATGASLRRASRFRSRTRARSRRPFTEPLVQPSSRHASTRNAPDPIAGSQILRSRI